MNTRNRTSSEHIGYGLSIFLFFRSFIKKDIWKIIVLFYKEKSCINQSGIGYKQKYKPKKIFERKKKENRGIHHWWNINKNWFRINWYGFGLLLSNLRVRKSLELVGISKERNMLLAERFISSLVGIQGQHPVSTDGWRYLVSTAQACKFLRLPHHIHSPYEKSIIIERTMQYMIKDRTECFDDYFPCRRNKCRLIRTCDALNEYVYGDA